MNNVRRKLEMVKMALSKRECIFLFWDAEQRFLKVGHTGNSADIRSMYEHIAEDLPKWVEKKPKQSRRSKNAPMDEPLKAVE